MVNEMCDKNFPKYRSGPTFAELVRHRFAIIFKRGLRQETLITDVKDTFDDEHRNDFDA